MAFSRRVKRRKRRKSAGISPSSPVGLWAIQCGSGPLKWWHGSLPYGEGVALVFDEKNKHHAERLAKEPTVNGVVVPYVTLGDLLSPELLARLIRRVA